MPPPAGAGLEADKLALSATDPPSWKMVLVPPWLILALFCVLPLQVAAEAEPDANSSTHARLAPIDLEWFFILVPVVSMLSPGANWTLFPLLPPDPDGPLCVRGL